MMGDQGLLKDGN